MKTITVHGLWHLGCVTAASLAGEGFEVWGLDDDAAVIERLQTGQPPVFEPGLAELIAEGQAAGRLHFTTDPTEALGRTQVLWVAFDTPVDEEDRADVGFVTGRLEAVLSYLPQAATVIISSQLPVGTTGALARRWAEREPQKRLSWCYSPENLRLGQALKAFRAEDRIVAGMDEADTAGRELVGSILGRFCPRIEWMSVESAEMTKHALNAFLAVSVAMINEVARICELTGADAKEVERGLKSERRIGPRAYLGPGGPFAGGTLARDLRFLVQLGAEHGLETPLMAGTLASNELHKGWVQAAAAHALGQLPFGPPPRVTILGLTYKPGTDTLRRSEAIALGQWLVEQGAVVTFHDPQVKELPPEIAAQFRLTNDLEAALLDTNVLIVMTGWPIYKEAIGPELLGPHTTVIDQTRFLEARLNNVPGLNYLAVGKPRGRKSEI